jgi:capsid protein
MGVISDAMIANDLGVDIEDVYAQRASEAELRETYGLTDPMLMAAEGGMAQPVDGADDPEDDPDDDMADDDVLDDEDLDAGAARERAR